MAVRRNRARIYHSWWHVIFAFLVILVPFLFLFIFSEFAHIAATTLFFNVLVSIARLAVAYAVSVVAAWVLAICFYQGKRAVIALPIFDVLQSIPIYAALPIAALLMGPSTFTVIFFLIFAVIWPIFFSVIGSLKLIRNDWVEVTRVFRLRGWAYVKQFLWPVSTPGLITGSIIGLGDGWEALVTTEIIVGVKSGLGNFFQSFSTNPTVTAFGILALLLIIFSINKLVWLPLLDWGHSAMEE